MLHERAGGYTAKTYDQELTAVTATNFKDYIRIIKTGFVPLSSCDLSHWISEEVFTQPGISLCFLDE